MSIKTLADFKRALVVGSQWKSHYHGFRRHPSQPPATASMFTATKYDTAQDKADFANTLLKFIHDWMPQQQFTKKFYNRMMNTFGHIAHYDREGFMSVWFVSPVERSQFIEHLLRWPCYGQPEFTFCDVETFVQARLQSHDVLLEYRRVEQQYIADKELENLRALLAKHPEEGKKLIGPIS